MPEKATPIIRTLPPPETIKDSKVMLGLIKNNCSDKERLGVLLISKDNPNRAEKAANAIIDGLMLTLQEIGSYSLREAMMRDNDRIRDEYVGVSQAISYMAVCLRAVIEDRVPFKIDKRFEKKHGEVGDRLFAYQAKDFSLEYMSGELEFEKVRILIRPESFDELIEKEGKVYYPAEPRMAIFIKPRTSLLSEINIRVDQVQENEVIYDITMQTSSGNPIERLKFSSSATPTMASQIKGHHFNSHIKVLEFKTGFKDVMEAINDNFRSKAEAPKLKGNKKTD